MNTVNIREVFASLDSKREAAIATIAKYREADRAEASRIARLYDNAALTSIRHLTDTAARLVADFHPIGAIDENKGVDFLEYMAR